MTKLQYKETVIRALESLDNTSDFVDAVRKILSSCGVEFPYGECRGVLYQLSKNNFPQWKSCTLEEAEKYANEGVPTIGINDGRVVIIVPNDYALSSDRLNEKSKFVISANSITNEEESSMKFFASSESVFALSSSYGTTTDVPSSITSDGFGGFYVPVSANKKGVTNKVARFVQMASDPCVAYSIMMGYYYLFNKNNSTTVQDASKWFDDNVSTYYNSVDGATWNAMALVTKMEYNLATMKSQLDLGKPVAITGKNSSGTLHMALAVAYIGNGGCTAQYVVIDPLYKIDGINKTPFPTTFAEFKTRFPNKTSNWLKGSNEKYLSNPMCTFNDV